VVITYSTNFMGPVNMKWYRDRGLTRKVSEVLEEGRIGYPKGLGPGDVWEYEELTTHYCAGRIDVRDDSKQGYDGWDEYGLAPMHEEDWNAFGAWLDDLTTTELWEYDMLVSIFETEVLNGRKIRWWTE
jgi:hypothetical protein